MERLREHDVHIEAGRLHLRPMTEDDWDLLHRWNNDPEVLYYSEGDEITSWSLDDLQEMYRGVSPKALLFIAELDGQPIGDVWVQQMNIERILDRYPGMDLFRMPIFIGEKQLWGKGWGTIIIGLLTQFAFEERTADAVFAFGVADSNPRSRRAFEKNGYIVDQKIPTPQSSKSKMEYDLVLTRERYEQIRRDRERDAIDKER
jgi:RimJ/RimL family protein N-acetyltransferase